MKQALKNFLILLIFFLIAGWIFSSLSNDFPKEKPTDLSTFITALENQEVTKIVVTENVIHFSLKSGESLAVKKEPQDSLSELLRNFNITQELLKDTTVEIRDKGGSALLLSTILPYLIPFLIISFIIYIMFRQIQGVNQRALSFGQSGAREVKPDEKNRVTFADVAGVFEAKQELAEVVDFLRFPKKFINLGAKIPKGVLLVGSPGTGKTLLARAVAGEANVPFFHVSGSEFVEMFVGVGASRVRSLFTRAKKSAPCILFIDELDAVGRQRGTGLGGSHDEREQTLNQILVELDGFEPNSGVVVISATNRPDVLDQALLRPGRFDRRVILDEPDLKDREAILKIHARGKPLAKEINLRTVAERTSGFSGADLANLLNEAAILTARRNKKEIGPPEVFESIEKVLLGPERKSHILSEEEKKITAYHEAGHALVSHELPLADPVHKVSIIARGRAGGYTMKVPSEDRHLTSKAEFEADIAVALAGFVTEKLIFNEVTTGASSDLRLATTLARRLVTEYGMSEKLGPRTFGEREALTFLGKEITEQRDYSEKIAQVIDEEVGKIIQEAYTKAQSIIRKNHKTLQDLAKALLERETLERQDFEAIAGPKKKARVKRQESRIMENVKNGIVAVHDS